MATLRCYAAMSCCCCCCCYALRCAPLFRHDAIITATPICHADISWLRHAITLLLMLMFGAMLFDAAMPQASVATRATLSFAAIMLMLLPRHRR